MLLVSTSGQVRLCTAQLYTLVAVGFVTRRVSDCCTDRKAFAVGDDVVDPHSDPVQQCNPGGTAKRLAPPHRFRPTRAATNRAWSASIPTSLARSTYI